MSRSTVVAAAIFLLGCPPPPPASQLPSAQAAIDRMRATTACGTGIQADAKLDHFASESGRVRTELLFIAQRPANIRMDVLAPVVGTVATLTTDGQQFQASDMRAHRFLYGPASACNVARITRIPIPVYVLVSLLMGRAPVLKHDAAGLAAPSVTWDGAGYYVIKIAGNDDSIEEMHIAPHPDDWNKPWAEQRMRVLDVAVTQRNVLLYHAELDTFEKTTMSGSGAGGAGTCDDVCMATGGSPTPPSGPICDAEIPRRIHVEVPVVKTDVQFRYDKVGWNPPLAVDVFKQRAQPGLEPTPVECTDE